MHTVKMLSESLELARQLGYQIREDQLDGAGGGHCQIRGRKWLLLDVTQSADEQLRDVLDAVREEFSTDGPSKKGQKEGQPQKEGQEGQPQISPELAEALAGNAPETDVRRQWAA